MTTRILQDLRFALRGFRRNPGFAVMAVLTLAVALAGNTALFSVLDDEDMIERPARVSDVRFPTWDRLGVDHIVIGAVKFEIEIPTELTMMIRAMMTIEGVGKEIHPDLDVFGVAKPYLAKIVWQRYHPMKLGNDLVKLTWDPYLMEE